MDERWLSIAVAVLASVLPVVVVADSRKDINRSRYSCDSQSSKRAFVLGYESRLIGLDLLVATLGISLACIAILISFAKNDPAATFSIARIALLASGSLLVLFPMLLTLAKKPKPCDKIQEFVAVWLVNGTGATAFSLVIFYTVKSLLVR